MESRTKNKQSEETLQRMVAKFYPKDSIASCLELTEGYFNVAYLVTLKCNKQFILKIAPQPGTRVMSYEKNIMFCEVEAMRRVAENAAIPAPKVLGYDDSCVICPSPYFLMEKLEGDSLSSIKDQLKEEEIEAIYTRLGEVNKEINAIRCPCFGYPGQTRLQGKKWYEVFKEMLSLGITDAEAGAVDLRIDTEKLLERLEQDKEIFDEVLSPRLVHWDCWDGNIFVKNKQMVGLIDWERCLWADPLMEVGFRTYEDHSSFWKGYGVTRLTAREQRRALWYDIYALLLMSLECEYRQYDTLEMYEWANGLLKQQVMKLSSL